ncbi:MAG TPA: hypothetical protein VI758_09170, partial [Bacteroidota bacterium]
IPSCEGSLLQDRRPQNVIVRLRDTKLIPCDGRTPYKLRNPFRTRHNLFGGYALPCGDTPSRKASKVFISIAQLTLRSARKKEGQT